MSRISVNHNLNIQTYKFSELLALFDLTYDMNLDDLKRAKTKVLYMHPDKSKLPSQYFLFYKRAFELVVQYFEEKTKQTKEVPVGEKSIKYVPNISNHPNEDEFVQTIQKYQQKSSTGFNDQFNELFEKNMATPINEEKNQWFKEENPVIDVSKETVTSQNMSGVFHNIREKTAALSTYRGVENLYSGAGLGTKIYEDHETGNDDGYISADIFSKLKYDDLRRVHKDQTVLTVSEHDFDPSKRAHTIDGLSKERDAQNLTPMDKKNAHDLLDHQRQEYEKILYQKQFEAKIKTMEYEKKNKDVRAKFLRLEL